MTDPSGTQDAEEFAVNPMADLLFSIAAVFMLAVLLMLPLSHAAPRFAATAIPGDAGAKLHIGAEPVTAFLADPAGLMLSDGRRIDNAALADDARLKDQLRSLRERRERLMLVIAPGGEETAFQFEVQMAEYGPQTIRQIRLNSPCASVERLPVCLAAGAGPKP